MLINFSLQRYRLQSHVISVLEKKENKTTLLDYYYQKKKIEMQMCQFMPKGGIYRNNKSEEGMRIAEEEKRSKRTGLRLREIFSGRRVKF